MRLSTLLGAFSALTVLLVTFFVSKPKPEEIPYAHNTE